ncbi:MAG: hypothetical protein AB7K64_07200 [Variibacter sp.]
MRTVLPIHVFEPFTPDVIEGMDWAFEASIKFIEEQAGPASDAVREAVALQIVDAAQRGIRGREELRGAAISHWERMRESLPPHESEGPAAAT